MNEWIVPRQVVRSNVEAMDRWSGDAARALEASGLTRAEIDGGRRVTWGEFSALMNAFGERRSDDELMAFGEEYVKAFPGFREVAALFVSPALLYRFVVRASPRYWSEMDFELEEEGARLFRVRAHVHPASAPNRPFFASSIGMFRNLGTIVGAEPADIAAIAISAHHCAFALTVPEPRLARRLALGLSLKEAAADLGVRHETARSHLKRVMEKADVGRQADLVRALLAGNG